MSAINWAQLFYPDRKTQVWSKGKIISSLDPRYWRQDDYGHLINWDQYGNRDQRYGWEIDHIIPVALGGTDDLSNLRPLHCIRNASNGGFLGSLFKR